MTEQTAIEPTVIVLYGASGDLSHRLVLPALFRLAAAGLMPRRWGLVGSGRGGVSDDDFRAGVHDSLQQFGPKPSEGPWEEFAGRLRFAGGGFADDDPGQLLEVLGEARRQLGGRPRLVHYLAVPPEAFAPISEAIGAHGLAEGSRVVYEKPFGTSLGSFERLDRCVHELFAEEQIYRIDHFLGKEATQAIHVARFANGLFAHAWDRHHVQRVEIDVPETLDVANRASFYDSTGAILDMLVTHLFQLAAEVAMETPRSLRAGDVARAREEVLGCFQPLTWDDVVVGQYDGYREIDGVPAGSRTETFVAARLSVDNDRWRGVPFLLRTGKQMAESRQRVSVVFEGPVQTPEGLSCGRNVLGFELAGDGEIDLSLVTKRPGPETDLTVASARLPLSEVDTRGLPAYSRLLHDVLAGDRSLFTRPDGLRHVWEVADALLRDKPEPLPYEPGSWGPPEARRLAGEEGWLLGE